MKKHILNLGFTSFLVACGGSSDSLKNKELEPLSQTQTLERVEALRATEVMGKKAEELHIEKRVKFHSYSGLKILLNKILDKLYQDEFRAIEDQLWLALDSLSLRTAAEKQQLADLLLEISLLDDQAEKAINLYRESEGVGLNNKKQFINTSNEEMDINQKNILMRRNTLIARHLMETAEGYRLLVPQENEEKYITAAAIEIIGESKNLSLASPVSYNFKNSGVHLPKLYWSGGLSLQFGGSAKLDGDYIPGKTYGSSEKWSTRHGQSTSWTYLTPNMASVSENNITHYQFSLNIKVKGGGVGKYDGGFKNKSSHLNYHFSGAMNIAACDDLSACSPFVVLKPVTSRRISGAGILLSVNGVVIDGREEYLIDRTQGDTEVRVEVAGSHSHRGKSGDINDSIALSFQLIERNSSYEEAQHIKGIEKTNQFLNLYEWKRKIDSGLTQGRREERGRFIYRVLNYLQRSLRDDLNASQLNAVRMLHHYLILKAHEYYVPIIEELILEKRKNIKHFPVKEISEVMSQAINLDVLERGKEHHVEKLRTLLSALSTSELKEKEIDLDFFEEVKTQKNLILSLYANIHSKLSDLLTQWQQELSLLEQELAQLTHMNEEELAGVKYEIQ